MGDPCALIRRLIEAEARRRRMLIGPGKRVNASAIARAAGLSDATLSRLMRGDDGIDLSGSTIRALMNWTGHRTLSEFWAAAERAAGVGVLVLLLGGCAVGRVSSDCSVWGVAVGRGRLSGCCPVDPGEALPQGAPPVACRSIEGAELSDRAAAGLGFLERLLSPFGL